MDNCVLLVGAHNLLIEALASALNQQPDFEVVAQSGSLADGHGALALGGINIAAVATELPDGDGLELVRELRDTQPRSIPVLVLAKSFDPAVHDLARKAGASEVLTTDMSFEEIILVLRRITE